MSRHTISLSEITFVPCEQCPTNCNIKSVLVGLAFQLIDLIFPDLVETTVGDYSELGYGIRNVLEKIDMHVPAGMLVSGGTIRLPIGSTTLFKLTDVQTRLDCNPAFTPNGYLYECPDGFGSLSIKDDRLVFEA